MSFTTFNPLKELIFGRASCSLTTVEVVFNKTDASQPYFIHNFINILAQVI
jgi:hypothetical protein